MDVKHVLEEAATKYKSQVTFIFENKSVDFSALKNVSLSLATCLLRLGLCKADRVAIYFPNRPEYIYFYIAIYCLGIIAVFLVFITTCN